MPQNNDTRPIEWVTADIIRQHFNKSQFYERMLTGEFKIYLKRSSHPETPPKGEPYCTRSQIAFYYTFDGDLVAVVHQYLRSDGTIGASGKPDPKRLYLEDRILSVKTEVNNNP